MIRETISPHPDPDYSREFQYDTEGACSVKRVWVDETQEEHGFWLEAQDGQRVRVPEELRKLIAKRLREATFK